MNEGRTVFAQLLDFLPKTEDLTILYLNRFFDLNQPGEYALQVQIAVPKSEGQGETNVISGVARFEIWQAH